MKNKTIQSLVMLAVGLVASSAWANNCATCNSAAEGKICYASDEKVPFYCDGSNWQTMRAGQDFYTFSGSGKPLIGANGSSSPTMCTGAPGSTCGGGVYAGDGNLVAAPGGCTDSTTPTCAGGTDSVKKQWRTSDNPGGNSFKKSRYGYNISEASVTSSFPAAYYCKQMTYGGHSDWYLPTDYELQVLMTNAEEIGGFNTTDKYWGINEMRGGCSYSDCYPTQGYPAIGKVWGANSGERTSSNYVRCVRRN